MLFPQVLLLCLCAYEKKEDEKSPATHFKDSFVEFDEETPLLKRLQKHKTPNLDKMKEIFYTPAKKNKKK